MSYTIDQLSGLIATTHTKYPKQELTITWDDHRFEAARILNKDSIKKQGGTTITGKAMLDQTGNARWVDFYEKDQLGQGETLHEFTMPWKTFTTNWSWDEKEILMNRHDPEGFIDLAKVKEVQAQWNLAKLFEDSFWVAPTSSTSKEMRGLSYYVRMINADSTTAGWTGKTIRFRDTTTSTECAGIDANVYSQWCNWADIYTSINDDFVDRVRKAFLYSKFRAPLGATQFEVRKGAKRRCYTGQTVKLALYKYLDAKDDVHASKETLGRMVVSEGTDLLINGHDVMDIDALESYVDPQYAVTTPYPFFCVDFSHFTPITFTGYWMEKRGPIHGGTIQHTVWSMFIDGMVNIWSDSPRSAGFVIHKAIVSA